MTDATNRSHYFYQGDRLQAVQSDQHSVTFFCDAQRPLVQREQNAEQGGMLLCDKQHSVLQIASAIDERIGYSPYGYTSRLPSPDGGLAFNGEFADPAIKAYVLGSYRLYSPMLMRFYSPDSESPFQRGGVNAYVYCLDDPVNFRDSSGHSPMFQNLFDRLKPSQTGHHTSVKRHATSGALKVSAASTEHKSVAGREALTSSHQKVERISASPKLQAKTPTPHEQPSEDARFSINYSQYHAIKYRYKQDRFTVQWRHAKKEFSDEQLKREIARIERMESSLEIKKAYSLSSGFFSKTPIRYANSTARLAPSAVASTIRTSQN